LLRAQAIAGSVETAQELLDRVRRTVIGEGIDTWTYLADLPARVQSERGKQSDVAIPIKTGRGGLMDLDFLPGNCYIARESGKTQRCCHLRRAITQFARQSGAGRVREERHKNRITEPKILNL
jgi:glutamine synthetase adenylyltransferase